MNKSKEREHHTPYNQIAGQSLERLAAISDGIFAVAMTLLVLDLRDPAREAIRSEQDLGNALFAMFPQFITYLMSFLTLAIFWNGQQAQLNNFAQANRHLTWIHMAFLFGVLLCRFRPGCWRNSSIIGQRSCVTGPIYFSLAWLSI
jgi:uncharacterized membrane protein